MPRKYTVSERVVEHCKKIGFKKGNKPVITVPVWKERDEVLIYGGRCLQVS